MFLDLVEYYTKNGGALPYDPWTTHAITVSELESCARAQGTTFRQGDILILRVGFIQKYNRESNEARAALSERPETLYARPPKSPQLIAIADDDLDYLVLGSRRARI